MTVAMEQRTGRLTVMAMLDRVRADIPEYVNHIRDDLKRTAAERIYQAISDGHEYQIKVGPVRQRSSPFEDAEEYLQVVSIALIDPKQAEIGEYTIKPLEPMLPYDGDVIGTLRSPFEREGVLWKRVF